MLTFSVQFPIPHLPSPHHTPTCTRFLYSLEGFNHSDEHEQGWPLSQVRHGVSHPWKAEFHSPLTATVQDLWFTGKQ